MNAWIFPHRPDQEYFFREGCHILELLNDASSPDLSLARARVAPGIRTVPHRLRGTTERYVIQEGAGRVFLGKDTVGRPVGPQDVVVIPAGVVQSICNEGPGDLVFLAICLPRFETSCYEALEANG